LFAIDSIKDKHILIVNPDMIPGYLFSRAVWQPLKLVEMLWRLPTSVLDAKGCKHFIYGHHNN